MNLKRILIAGEGGQGIQALAHIFVETAFAAGKQVTFLPNFGVEQRGGVSLAFIQISDNEISFPKFQNADIVVIFAERAVERIKEYLTDNTVIIFDNSLIKEEKLSEIHLEKVAIPASYYAKEKLIPRVFNIIILGALAAEVGDLKVAKIENAIETFFAAKIAKEPQLKHFNLKALEYGYELTSSLTKEAKWRKKSLKK